MTNLHSHNQHRDFGSLRVRHLRPPPPHGRPVSHVEDGRPRCRSYLHPPLVRIRGIDV